MIDYLVLGPVPVEEECVPCGGMGDAYLAKKETEIYADMLRRVLPPPETANAYIKVKRFEHEFGPYHEAAVFFDTEDDTATVYAYDIECDLPERWDEEAIRQLDQAGITGWHAARRPGAFPG